MGVIHIGCVQDEKEEGRIGKGQKETNQRQRDKIEEVDRPKQIPRFDPDLTLPEP